MYSAGIIYLDRRSRQGALTSRAPFINRDGKFKIIYASARSEALALYSCLRFITGSLCIEPFPAPHPLLLATIDASNVLLLLNSGKPSCEAALIVNSASFGSPTPIRKLEATAA